MRTIGGGEGGADSAGPQPAAFQAASANGKAAFFTSPELLTDNANTGPESRPPRSGAARSAAPTQKAKSKPSSSPKSAVGMATDSEYLYWADPLDGTIGRAKLAEPESADPTFITLGEVGCGENSNRRFKEEVQRRPRYVAVDAGHIYWSATGCPEEPGKPKTEGAGAIGRCTIACAEPESELEEEFIPGRAEPSPGTVVNQVDNPQGVAVNATHIYWANDSYGEHRIGRAKLEGEEAIEVEPKFFTPAASRAPFGVALDTTHIYFTSYAQGNNSGFVSRVPLEGGEEEELFIGDGSVRGVALDTTHVYWTNQGEEAIGRAGLAEFAGTCETTVLSCERKFIEVSGAPAGLALDTTDTHILWSVNGESRPTPATTSTASSPKAARSPT